MRKIGTLFLILIVCMLSLLSCATVPRKAGIGDVKRIMDAVNRGDSAWLAERSALPFLLDGEIILLEPDIAALWNNLTKAGFNFRNGVILSLTPAGPESAAMFGETMELTTFFAKYVEPNSAIADVESGAGRFLLLIDPARAGKSAIRGLMGPLL